MKPTVHLQRLNLQRFKTFFFCTLITLAGLGFTPPLLAQAYIEHSRAISGVSAETVAELTVDAGNSYILGTTTDINYPVTLGGVPNPGTITRPVLIKLDPSGNLVWSRYLPFSNTAGVATNTAMRMSFQNGILYILSCQNATDIPVTDGSVAGGGGTDIMFTKVDANTGAVLHNGYFGGSVSDDGIMEIVIENGDVYIAYSTNSPDIPTTTGPAYTSGYDMMIHKINASGNIVYSTYFGNISGGRPVAGTVSLAVSNGIAYLVASVVSTSGFSTTDGSVLHGSSDFAVLRLDANGNRSLATFIGGSGTESSPSLFIDNDDIYISGFTTSTNYPVTDATTKYVNPTLVLTKLNSSGNIIYSGYRAGTGSFFVGSRPVMLWKNSTLYVAFCNSQGAATVSATDGSFGSSVLLKINAESGVTEYAQIFGEIRANATSSWIDMAIDDNGIYTVTPIQTASSAGGGAFTTDGSTRTGRSGAFVTRHSLDGHLLFASFLTSAGTNFGGMYSTAAYNGKMYVAGSVNGSAGFPVTATPLGNANGSDQTWTVYSFCPSMPATNMISPLSQSVCQNGSTQTLTGNEVVYASSQMPTLYINGLPYQQTEIRARYQWQVATSSSGPWTNINAGTKRDYLPGTGTQNFYYRRLVLPPSGCGDTPVSISAVAEVLISANAAPTVTAGIFNTCVNTPVNINATASGGTGPYTYSWDNGIGSTTNTATVTPASNSVYTMTVIDANGCQQIGQVIVNAYKADAGPDTVGSCVGTPVRIGTAPPAGLSGVTYSWTPATGMDDPTIAQPLATPGVVTKYFLQMTIPVSGGGTCSTIDSVVVRPVAAPATPNFAGPDQATCKGGTLSLGTAAEAGFTYSWSPGSYLSSVSASTTTFNTGGNMPQPNPFAYTLTASSNGCSFSDQVTASVLDVDAGEDYCGPRTVGAADRMPGVTGKTWLWEVLSGPGTITGATNTPTTTVSASTSTTTYRVTVSYLGASCSDLVVVDPCGPGGCPNVKIDTVATYGCPNTAFGPVSLRANPSNLPASAWVYTWSSSPAGGLSSTTGTSITLTDNIERDVTVTVTRVDNPAITCSATIHVNSPSWSLPVFNAPDQSICPTTSVGIGTAAMPGYFYTWQNVNAGDENASNPTVSPASTTEYPIEVKDMANGCKVQDTVQVTVKPLINNPGPDWVTCSNASIGLGSPALPGYTYSWSPQVANYQNGTTYQSAEPQVLIATTQDFTLTVTDAQTGCTSDSTVHIVVDNGNTLPAMSDTTICPGGSATIGLPAWSGVTYSWSPATGLSSTTVAQPTASPAATQTYTLTITYYDAGGAPVCTKSGTVTVTVASPQITMTDESICPSGALYNLSNGVTVTGAASYSWSPGILVTNPNVLSTTVKNNPNAPTTFTLTATDANGCATSASKVVSPVNAAPEAGSQGYVCVGDSRKLGAVSNTGTLSWTVNPAIAGTLSPANGATPVFTPAIGDAGKKFTFILTQNIGGCINVDSVSIFVRSLVLPVMPAQTVCMNAPATMGVSAQPYTTYSWSPVAGLTDPDAAMTTVSSVTGNSVYTLTATDVYGCSASGNAAVGANAVPAPSVTIPDITAVMGSSGTPFSPQISPMPAAYTYTWSPANYLDNAYIANAKATPVTPGSFYYNLAVTDGNGCTTTASARLNVVTSSTLPVTISSFTADIKGCGVQLNWKIESPDNFSRFIVERSNDGRYFRSVGTIYLDPVRQVYSFDESDPGNGTWFYRLRLVDLDGSIKYSKVVTAKVNCASKEMLVVYPNPLADRIYIRSSKPVQRVQLYSLTGQVVLQKEYRQSQAAVILMTIGTNLPTGIYMLRVIQADGSIQTSKVIKE